MKEKIELCKVITYKEMLIEIDNNDNHLLLGNGFNHGLGINTGYSAIFEEMIEKRYSLYNEVLLDFEECNRDLELFIGKLMKDVNNEFLKKYISNKIKLDFMEATQSIVKKSIKNVYAEKNEGVYILLEKFNNYFTLNFDSFLYNLLLHFKANGHKDSIVLTPSLSFIEEDLNQREDNIYKEITELRKNGEGEIYINDQNKTTFSFSNERKTEFTAWVKKYSRENNKEWKDKDIKRVVTFILEEEKKISTLKKVDDGFIQTKLFDDSEYIFDVNNVEQNLFFLHGAFHIYEEDGVSKKIMQQTHKALYTRLEEVINDDDKDIVTIFQTTNKLDDIEKNAYLSKCLEKLKSLSGKLVLIGCSMSDNDSHIFKNINESNIDTVY
ncbi:MAG: DUF4917 family protein, partial [Bacilli bacterium]